MFDSVFSSAPEVVQLDTLCDAADLFAVKNLLESHPGFWLTGSEIERRLGWPRLRTAEKVRRVVSELQLCGVPVVQGHAGFTLATGVGMLDVAIEDLVRRRDGLNRKIGALRSCRDDMATGQQKLWWRSS